MASGHLKIKKDSPCTYTGHSASHYWECRDYPIVEGSSCIVNRKLSNNLSFIYKICFLYSSMTLISVIANVSPHVHRYSCGTNLQVSPLNWQSQSLFLQQGFPLPTSTPQGIPCRCSPRISLFFVCFPMELEVILAWSLELYVLCHSDDHEVTATDHFNTCLIERLWHEKWDHGRYLNFK